MLWTRSADCASEVSVVHGAWTRSTTCNCTSSKNAVDLVQLITPVIGRNGPGIEPGHLEQHSGVPEADFLHPGALRGVYIGLNHLAHPGVQSTLDGGLCVGLQPVIVEVGMGVHKHGHKDSKKL